MAQDPIDFTAVEQQIREKLDALNPEHQFGAFNTHVPCRIPPCVGTIVLNRSRKYMGDPANFIIGPGGVRQMTITKSYYCSTCRVQYHGLPEPPRGTLEKMG